MFAKVIKFAYLMKQYLRLVQKYNSGRIKCLSEKTISRQVKKRGYAIAIPIKDTIGRT